MLLLAITAFFPIEEKDVDCMWNGKINKPNKSEWFLEVTVHLFHGLFSSLAFVKHIHFALRNSNTSLN